MAVSSDLRKFVWYLEGRETGKPTQPAQMGSGVVVWLRHTATAQRRKYLLTCAHVVRGPAADGAVGAGPVLGDLLAWAPNKGFTKATDFPQRTSDQPIAGALRVVASVSTFDTAAEVAPADRLAANDWILLDVEDPRFQNVAAVPDWAEETVGSLTVVGYPGGALNWKTGETVLPTPASPFEFHKESEPGVGSLTGPAETRPGMSGGAVCNEQGELVGIHRARLDAQLAGLVILASHLRAELAARGYEVVPYETPETPPPPRIVPPTPVELRWQRVNLALAATFAVGLAVWSFLVLGILLFSVVAGALTSVGIGAALAFLFPQSGWASQVQAASQYLRRAGTGYVFISVFVGCLGLSASGTTIRVASLPGNPDEVKTVELRWGDANQTSQAVVPNGGWKWHWTGIGSQTVRLLIPGYASRSESVRPWRQTVIYGIDEFELLPFIVVTFPEPPPATMPDRVKARDPDFRWKLRISSRAKGASAWEPSAWQVDDDYYVGDPLILGGNGVDWPEERDLPAGGPAASVHHPSKAFSLDATRDYRVEVVDQHQELQLTAQVSAEEIGAIRRPIKMELKIP